MLEKNNAKDNKPGFTLAEILVVVGIIAILVAVSIPVFTGRAEKSREVTDVANMRAAKAAGANAFYNEEYLNKNVWNYSASGENRDYSAVYDARKGTLVKAAGGIEPYGKGTTTDGGTKYGDSSAGEGCYYDSKIAYKKQLINVLISIRPGYSEQVVIRWYRAF